MDHNGSVWVWQLSGWYSSHYGALNLREFQIQCVWRSVIELQQLSAHGTSACIETCTPDRLDRGLRCESK